MDVSPKAIRFARAMALVSQALPIPAALATGAALAACEKNGYEHPVGTTTAPEHHVGTTAAPEAPVGTTAAPHDPTADADAGAREPKVGLVSAPIEPPFEPVVGTTSSPTMIAPTGTAPDRVGTRRAPEVEVGKRAAPDAGRR